MPKSRRRKSNKAAQSPKSFQPEKRGWWTTPRAIFVGIATVVGFVVTLLALLPRLTIVPMAEPDFAHGSFGTVQITNTGYVPLYDLNFAIGLCEIDFGTPNQFPQRCDDSPSSRLLFTPWHRSKLSMDDAYTISLDDVFYTKGRRQIAYADFSMTAIYRPLLWPWHREVEVRFTSHKLADGRMVWFVRPAK